MTNPVGQHFRCPDKYLSFGLDDSLGADRDFFQFAGHKLYGRVTRTSASSTSQSRSDAPTQSRSNQTVYLPFDIAEVVKNLRQEIYHAEKNGHHPADSFVGKTYYALRPWLPVGLRKHLQKLRLKGWRRLKFPSWPVDRTVDSTLEQLLLLSIRARGLQEIPFIWFWPNGTSSCAIMSHDVETEHGRDFCSTLMDIDDAFGIKASFQVVPEERYAVSGQFLDSLRTRGFEINVQDLNHDGHLFRERNEFLKRVIKINRYGREFKAEGFRAAILYRRQEWFDALEFSYDMSVPNVAHLDPQHGGCCTVMPYFVGNLVELPVTMTQDYSLFHILEQHSIDLWKRQMELVMENHGLVHFIVHPDYIVSSGERATYGELLDCLVKLRDEKNVWMPLPGEVASWWRQRSLMKLTEVNGKWQIDGDGNRRARVAYASEQDGKLVYSFVPKSQAKPLSKTAGSA